MDNRIYVGPSMTLSQEIDEMKYRQVGETFDGKIKRLASALSDDESHRLELEEIFGEMRFLAAGRVQSAMGADRITTAYNCFVSGEYRRQHELNHGPGQVKQLKQCVVVVVSVMTSQRSDHVVGRLSLYSPLRLALLVFHGNLSMRSVRQSALQDIDEVRRWACLRVDHPDVEEFM